MSADDEPLPALDPGLIDSLVDGELPDTDRRRLLEQLDRMPGGWRACALAFLEAQCWREAMGPVGQRPEPSPQIVRPSVSRPWRGTIGTLLAMAACFLIALGVGVAIRSGWFSERPGAPSEDIASGTPRADRPAGRPTQGDPSSVLASDPRQSSPFPLEPRGWQPEASPVRSAPTTPVTFTDPEGRVSEPFDLPVVKRDRLDESWFRPAPVPPHVRDMLHRMGYEVQQSRDLLPAQTEDGRRVVVPVDEWKVHFVGNRAFQ